MKVFVGADLIAYIRTFFAPSYMPFPIARHTARQMTRATKSATYRQNKDHESGGHYDCSAILNAAKVIGVAAFFESLCR